MLLCIAQCLIPLQYYLPARNGAFYKCNTVDLVGHIKYQTFNTLCCADQLGTVMQSNVCVKLSGNYLSADSLSHTVILVCIHVRGLI